MLGLKRGFVKLTPHQSAWDKNARETIAMLKNILGDTALDIQHIGSTAVRGICSKPVIDIVIGVGDPEDIRSYIRTLEQSGVIFRGEVITGQLFFVMGDFNNDIRTHHIHVVKWKSADWDNYINFRDYLNAFPEKAKIYEEQKRRLAGLYADNRKCYTAGKQELIKLLLEQARLWKNAQNGS